MAIKMYIKPFFFICGSELLILLILYDLGAETNISDVYCSSSDLAYIYRRIQDGRHFRYLLLKQDYISPGAPATN